MHDSNLCYVADRNKAFKSAPLQLDASSLSHADAYLCQPTIYSLRMSGVLGFLFLRCGFSDVWFCFLRLKSWEITVVLPKKLTTCEMLCSFEILSGLLPVWKKACDSFLMHPCFVQKYSKVYLKLTETSKILLLSLLLGMFELHCAEFDCFYNYGWWRKLSLRSYVTSQLVCSQFLANVQLTEARCGNLKPRGHTHRAELSVDIVFPAVKLSCMFIFVGHVQRSGYSYRAYIHVWNSAHHKAYSSSEENRILKLWVCHYRENVFKLMKVVDVFGHSSCLHHFHFQLFILIFIFIYLYILLCYFCSFLI